MKQSDTLGGLILIPLTLSVLFCHLQSEICRAERKVCLFCFVSVFCFCASLPCSTLFWGLVLSCFLSFFFFPGVVCFISQAIWLVSESNFAPVSPCTPPPPSSHRHTHILHTFPQTDTPPSHSKQINSSLAALGTPQWNTAAHSSPENYRLLLMFLVHYGSRRPDSPSSCVCVYVWIELRADSGGFRLAAAPQVRIQALSPLVYLTQPCPSALLTNLSIPLSPPVYPSFPVMPSLSNQEWWMECKEGQQMFANLIHPAIVTLSLRLCRTWWLGRDFEEAFVCVCLTKLCMRAISNISTSVL